MTTPQAATGAADGPAPGHAAGGTGAPDAGGGAVLGDRYRLVATVGRGARAEVHLAVDAQLRRAVAVKVLAGGLADDERFLDRFRAEARAAAALSHPNIVGVYDWGEDLDDDGEVVAYLVTEYLGGGSLRRMLEVGRSLTPSQAVLVGLDASRALEHAHRRGVVHRDVTPGNLLFDPGGRLRLADFGLARAMAEAAWTEPAGWEGAARYVAPEVASGARLDGGADVYALALVLVEAVTGSVPLLGADSAETLARRAAADVEVDPALGPLRGVLGRALRVDPGERPDAGELAIGLLAAAEQLPRPDPLPLVATLGDGAVTSELRIDAGGVTVLSATPPRTGADPVAGDPAAGDLAAGGPAAGDAGPAEVLDLTGPLGIVPAPEPAPHWGRDPIVVADEHQLLQSSRPASFGRVEPLRPEELLATDRGVADAGAPGAGVAGAPPVDGVDGPTPGRGSDRSGGPTGRWVVLALVLAALAVAALLAWSLVR